MRLDPLKLYAFPRHSTQGRYCAPVLINTLVPVTTRRIHTSVVVPELINPKFRLCQCNGVLGNGPERAILIEHRRKHDYNVFCPSIAVPNIRWKLRTRTESTLPVSLRAASNGVRFTISFAPFFETSRCFRFLDNRGTVTRVNRRAAWLCGNDGNPVDRAGRAPDSRVSPPVPGPSIVVSQDATIGYFPAKTFTAFATWPNLWPRAM